jgi:cytochrome c peroxidase
MNFKLALLSAGLLPLVSFANVPDIKALQKDYARPTEIPYLADNPYSKEKEVLGKLLFFDPRLSKSNMTSCATCHNPSFAWGDALPLGVGHEHKKLGRKTPTILNLAWYEKLMWDGRFVHYEGQAMGPVGSPDEMAMPLTGPDSVVEKLKKISGYKEYFKKAFPKDKDPVNTDNMSKAIAIFERGIVSGKAPFDQWVEGKEDAISAKAKEGFVLFNTKAKCSQCHSGWAFTDGSFHDIGLKSTDIGRGKFLKLKTQQHAFKTPGLRNITLRGPFMHDGSEETLEKVVEFYSRGGDVKRDSLSGVIKPSNLSKKEIASIVEFMKTLTSDDEPQVLPILPR